jgi:hypothetical protein
MLARGIYVIGFSFPVVPKGQARIRTQMSAAHSRDMEIGRSTGAVGREAVHQPRAACRPRAGGASISTGSHGILAD